MDAARNDPARFDALYRKYLAQVYNFAVYELGDHHEAEDATERTFLSALAGLTGSRSGRGPRTGPRRPRSGSGCSGSRATSWPTPARPAPPTRSPSGDRFGSPDPVDLEESVARRELATAAWGAVDRLTGDRRRAVVLRFVHEMTTVEIASILGRSEGPSGSSSIAGCGAWPASSGRRIGTLGDGEGATRDGENEALVVDRYLESLLSRTPADADRPRAGAP